MKKGNRKIQVFYANGFCATPRVALLSPLYKYLQMMHRSLEYTLEGTPNVQICPLNLPAIVWLSKPIKNGRYFSGMKNAYSSSLFYFITQEYCIPVRPDFSHVCFAQKLSSIKATYGGNDISICRWPHDSPLLNRDLKYV